MVGLGTDRRNKCSDRSAFVLRPFFWLVRVDAAHGKERVHPVGVERVRPKVEKKSGRVEVAAWLVVATDPRPAVAGSTVP